MLFIDIRKLTTNTCKIMIKIKNHYIISSENEKIFMNG